MILQPHSFCSRVLWLLSCSCLCGNFKTGFHISVKNVVGILTPYQFALGCCDENHTRKQLGKKGFVLVFSLQSITTEGQSWNSRQKSEGGTKAGVVAEHHLLACSPRLAFLYSSGTPCVAIHGGLEPPR